MKRKKHFGFSDYEDNIENENREEKELEMNEYEDENEETEFGVQDNKVRELKSERDSLNHFSNIKKIIDTLSPFLRSEYSDDPKVKKILAKLITLAISEDEKEDEYLENYIPKTYSYRSGARFSNSSKNGIDSDKLKKLLESVYKSVSDPEVFKDILVKLLVKVITENPKNGDLVEYFNEMESESESEKDEDSMIEEMVENFIKSYSRRGYSDRVSKKFGKETSIEDAVRDTNLMKEEDASENFNEDEDENENKEGDSDVPFDEYVEDEGEELEVEEISDKIANRLFNKIFKNK
jgi:hypothetical protein